MSSTWNNVDFYGVLSTKVVGVERNVESSNLKTNQTGTPQRDSGHLWQKQTQNLEIDEIELNAYFLPQHRNSDVHRDVPLNDSKAPNYSKDAITLKLFSCCWFLNILFYRER